MAIAWMLRTPAVTRALIGVSRPAQVEDAVKALDRLDFSPEELAEIDGFATRAASICGRVRPSARDKAAGKSARWRRARDCSRKRP